jgi:FtsP/CotA-like multicopper oxidase with cupredoxin domain
VQCEGRKLPGSNVDAPQNEVRTERLTKERPMAKEKPDQYEHRDARLPRECGLSQILSRRLFLAAGSGIGTSLLVRSLPATARGSGVAQAAEHMHEGLEDAYDTWKDFVPGAPFVEPEVRRSVDGELRTTLRLQYAYKDIGGYRLFVRTYEGTVPGPTLRVKPGDLLRITLINDLPPNRDPAPVIHSLPHQFNTTNFHSHGLHVSPSGISDNVMRIMEPGKSYDIEIAIPADHIPGTNWYHPHAHGSADVQIASGAVGALIIEGDFADVLEIAAAQERLLVLTEAVFDSFGTIENFETLFPETAVRFLAVNGVREPTITMRPGEVQRWRILHAGWQDDIFMELEGHKLNAIARDGIPLSRMDQSFSHTPENARNNPKAMLIAPGQRIDVLVKAGAPGSYMFRAAPHNQGYSSPTGPIARIVVEGDPLSMKLPTKLPPSLEKIIGDKEITGTRVLKFSATHPEVEATEHWQEFRFLIDGKVFDPNRVDQRVRLGAVEEWTIINEHKDDHVFHIHTNDMEVTKVNGKLLPEPLWVDTMIVPRNGSITFRSRFLDFTGKYMLHCHMMNHEELGMMQVVEVYAD